MFFDFRAGILTLGRDWHTRVVANPDDLADHPIVQHAATDPNDYRLFAEPLGFAASSAFVRVTGDHEAFWEQLEARAHDSAEPTEFDLVRTSTSTTAARCGVGSPASVRCSVAVSRNDHRGGVRHT